MVIVCLCVCDLQGPPGEPYSGGSLTFYRGDSDDGEVSTFQFMCYELTFHDHSKKDVEVFPSLVFDMHSW